MADFLTSTPAGVEIRIKAVPGASRSRVVGMLGDELKIQVAAPAEKGKANAAIEKLLAECLGIPRRAVSVISGMSSPRKVVRVTGIAAGQVRKALLGE